MCGMLFVFQDTSPSPSEVLGSMYPPSFLPYSGETGAGLSASGPCSSSSSSGRLASFGGGLSPSQSPSSSNFLPALPKFQQAFGKKSHFDIIPSLSSLNVPSTNMAGSNPSLPGINPLQDNNLQVKDRHPLYCIRLIHY